MGLRHDWLIDERARPDTEVLLHRGEASHTRSVTDEQATRIVQIQDAPQSGSTPTLLGLPFEIRELILDQALRLDEDWRLECDWNQPFCCIEEECACHFINTGFGLFTVNKQLASEVLDILYSKTNLIMWLPDSLLIEGLALIADPAIHTFDPLRNLYRCIKNCRQTSIELRDWSAPCVLDGLKDLLHHLCDVYGLPGRMITVDIHNSIWYNEDEDEDEMEDENARFKRVFDVLDEHRGKRVKITILARYMRNGRSILQRFCSDFGFKYLEQVAGIEVAESYW